MKRYILLMLIVVLIGCKDNNEKEKGELICNVADPAAELPWLKEKVDELEKSDLKKYFYVSQCLYLGETVFTIDNCCPMCMTIRTVYRCDGSSVDNPDYTLVKSEKIVWQSEDFECLMM